MVERVWLCAGTLGSGAAWRVKVLYQVTYYIVHVNVPLAGSNRHNMYTNHTWLSNMQNVTIKSWLFVSYIMLMWDYVSGPSFTFSTLHSWDQGYKILAVCRTDWKDGSRWSRIKVFNSLNSIHRVIIPRPKTWPGNEATTISKNKMRALGTQL